jgi:hypothetical protein
MTKEEFLAGIGNWSNHRHLLWPALEATKHLKLPVLELGCGNGSTPFLQQYCKDNDLDLDSFDYDEEWARQFNAIHTNWNDQKVNWDRVYGVALIDESPGEHRVTSLQMVVAKIIVIHDSEPIGWNSSDYQVRPLFNKFKYMKDLQGEPGGAWATSVSNTIDVSKL